MECYIRSFCSNGTKQEEEVMQTTNKKLFRIAYPLYSRFSYNMRRNEREISTMTIMF